MKNLLLALVTISALALCVIATPAFAQKPCSLTNTNHNCTLTLDRNSFVFPPTLQLYPSAVVTVRIKNGHNFEAYTLDQAPGQATARPDVASSVLANLNAILSAASSLGAVSTSPVPPPLIVEEKVPEAHVVKKEDPCKQDTQSIDCRVDIIVQALKEEKADEDAAATKAAKAQQDALDHSINACDDPNYLSQFSTEECMLKALQAASVRILAVAATPSQNLYQELQAFLTPDAPTQSSPASLKDLLDQLCGSSPPLDSNHPCAINNTDNSLIHQQAAASAFAASVLSKLTKPPSSINIPSTAPYKPLTQPVLNAMQLVTEEQAALDAIRKDLEGYASRIQDSSINQSSLPE